MVIVIVRKVNMLCFGIRCGIHDPPTRKGIAVNAWLAKCSLCVETLTKQLTLLFQACSSRASFLLTDGSEPMKVKSSLKALKERHRDCKVVRRRGRVYVINKTDPRFKAKQG